MKEALNLLIDELEGDVEFLNGPSSSKEDLAIANYLIWKVEQLREKLNNKEENGTN